MDENGNYKVVYGLKLDQISTGDLKIMINAHGELGSIVDRSIEEIAKYISTIEQATGVFIECVSFFKGAGAILSRDAFY
jgi:hypothetical protein